MKTLLAIFLLFVLTGAQPLFAEMEVYSFDGTFLGYSIDQRTILTSNAKIVKIIPDGNVGILPILYLTTNCTGTPYTYDSLKGFISRVDSTYYETIGSSEIQTIGSSWYSNQCIVTAPADEWVSEIQVVPAETIPFTLPVNMPLSFKIKPKVVVIPIN